MAKKSKEVCVHRFEPRDFKEFIALDQ